MFYVRRMYKKDLRFAVKLTDTMAWNLTTDDFEFMMKLEPEACFVLLDDTERLGVVTNIIFDKVGWLGNLIVSRVQRRRGGGSQLLKHSTEFLKSKNVETIGLYSYIDTISFYEIHGFKSESEFSVLSGKAFSEFSEYPLGKAREQDIPEIVKFDAGYFGASRKKLLESIISNPNNVCYVVKQDGEIRGYIVAKVYNGFAEIGPLICHEKLSDVAKNLLREVLGELEGSEISICLPSKESEIINMLTTFGLRQSFRVMRMFYGDPVTKPGIYVAESLERG